MAQNKVIRGAGGGGKGGGSARAAVEAKNTLRSRQFARIIDVICEGEIEGLVGANVSPEYAERSIYFDGVPLRNDQGQPNFDVNAFSWAFVPGVQNQPVIPTGGTVASEVQVSQEVKAGNTGGGPVVRSIPETYIDACRVTVTVPRLTEQNTENGDINGSQVQFAIDVQANGGGFVQVMAPTIKGKTNSEYQRSYEFDLPGTGPWDIRLRRITPDADKSNIQNQIYWSTYTKIVKQPLNYPNTALMGLKVDSALFSRVPSRAYKMRLLKVRVPSNYDPITRSYSGLWNGSFKVAWTDNPAWCWYDLATNERYGLGEYLDTSSIDKWTLYAIAQYCDELVPDGYGGTEPRFRCNLLLNTREEALKVLMNFASIFRGIVYWHTNSIFCSQDRPSSPVKLFTPANVIDGVFNYSGSARQARHTVAMVSWNDPENLYKQTVEYVEDRESIIRLGVREVEVTAMGCTSRGQANRLGKWILLTEREETDTITFRTGLEGCGVMPGEIIQTTDPARAGARVGGRVMGATANQLTLDGPVTLEAGKSYTVAVVLPSGAIEEKAVSWGGSSNTEATTLNLGSNLAQVPQQHAIWILQTETLVPELWRVLSTVEVEPNVVEITAVEHVPGKYAAVEQNLKLEARQTSAINVRPGAVANLSATTDVKKLNALEYTTRIFVSWTPPKEGAARYIVTWSRENENDKTEISNDPAFDIDDVPAGTFEISVVAENAIGLRGPATTITHLVTESGVEPDVQNLRLDPNFLSQDCPLAWDRLDWAIKYTVQVYDGATLLREEPVEVNKYVYTYAQNLADGGPRRSLTFKVKAHSWRGASANWATLAASNPAPATPQGVSLEAGPGQVSVLAERPADPDLEGMIVWMYSDSSVPTTSGNIVYKGKDNAFMKTGLQPGVPAYFKVAFYDTFGTSGLNVSSSVSATPTATGGIFKVTELPPGPADVSGETAVFLDVADTTIRGLYGWDGSAWKFTRDGAYLVANSVTADRMNVSQLSSISANMGTMTAGNFTLAADGFIKGGATNYTSGTGFWMGYHDSKYKWRVGTPGSSGAEWTGSAFNVYGPDGSVTISSGVVDWAKISGETKPQDGATRNVFRGDWATSTVYAVGDVVLKDGNGWSCVTAHTASSSNQPPSSGNGNTWWTLYAVKGSDGAQGLHALTVVVPNNAHTLPAASDGVVASYTGSGTTIQVFEGTTALSAVSSITANGQFTVGTPTQVPASTITVGARSYAGTTATIAQHSAMVAGTDSVVVTYPITVRRTDGTTVTLSATQTLTKSKAGVKGDAGVSAKAAFLTATSQVFQIAKNGTITPSSITLTATGQNVTGSPTFSVTSGTATLTGTGNTRTLASTGLTTDAATIKITWDGQEDYVTVVKVREGADGTSGANAIVAVLSNEAHTVPTDSAGNNGVFTGANTTMTIYNGTADDSANWTVTATVSNVTGSLSGKTYTVTGLSADTGYVDLTASRSGYASIVKRFVLTKSKAGPAGSPGAQGPAGPAVVVTANRALSFTATDGALDGSQADIVLTAAVSGITGPTYAWTFSGLQTNPTASTTSSQTITAAQFGTSKSATVTCTVNGSFVDQVTIVRLEKSTAEAGATVGANASNLKAGVGVNMVFNGDLTDGLAGVAHIYNSGGTGVTLGWNLSGYTVSGEGTGYVVKSGGPADGSVFDARFQNGQNKLAVTPGARYEVYAWLNTHRCEAAVNVHWYDAAGLYLGEVQAPYVFKQSGIQSTADMVQSFQFVTAPANARQADVRIRARTLGTDPYCFFSRVFFGAAGAGQTEPSPWSPGRGISQITPSNVSTYIANAAIGAAQIGSINLTGTSNFAVKSGTSGARMDMDSRRIKVYDASGVLRVQLGDLTV